MPRSINKTGIARVSTASALSGQTTTGAAASAAAASVWSENEPPAHVVEALQLSLLQGTIQDRRTIQDRIAVAPHDGTKAKKRKTSLQRKHQMGYMRWYGANPQNPGWLRGIQIKVRAWKPNLTKNTTRLSFFTACTKCATDECVCRIGERWFNQRVLANVTHNRLDTLRNMPKSTLIDANTECMEATGANKQTTKRTACQRRLASVYLDGKVKVSDDHLGAFLSPRS